MGSKTDISWTDSTWTPIRARFRGRVGWHCERVSEACRRCYAERMNRRVGTGRDFAPDELMTLDPGKGGKGEVEVFLDEKFLVAPLMWKRPRRIFVCSMTDLFGKFVKDKWIDLIFAVMALCPQHEFQVLTKRPQRQYEYCRTLGRHHTEDRVSIVSRQIKPNAKFCYDRDGFSGWFLPNVTLGTSIEDQKTAQARIPWLLRTPAARLFLSCEPMLGDVNPTNIVYELGDPNKKWSVNAVNGRFESDAGDVGYLRRVDQVIVGAESGPGARPLPLERVRQLRDFCKKGLGTNFFVKQLSAPHGAVIKDIKLFPEDLQIQEQPCQRW